MYRSHQRAMGGDRPLVIAALQRVRELCEGRRVDCRLDKGRLP